MIFVVFLRILDPYFSYYDWILFDIQVIILLMWGIIGGLHYKSSHGYFYRYVVIKNSILVFLIFLLLTFIVMSVLLQIIDPIGGNYGHKIIGTMALPAIFILVWMVVPFFSGFIISVISYILIGWCRNFFRKYKSTKLVCEGNSLKNCFDISYANGKYTKK